MFYISFCYFQFPQDLCKHFPNLAMECLKKEKFGRAILILVKGVNIKANKEVKNLKSEKENKIILKKARSKMQAFFNLHKH